MSLKKILLISGLLAVLSNFAQAEQPVRIQFDKSGAPVGSGVWQGAVSGGVTGDLKTELLGARMASNGLLHVKFKFTITGVQPMTILLQGILNTYTGRVVMNGRVAEGAFKGARVHEAGQLMDPNTSRFVGLIQVMPQSAR